MTTFVNNDVASGGTIYASDHNEMGSRVAAVVNGGIDNANISGTAAIATSKLADDAGITTAKIADDAVTAAKIDWASTGANAGIWWEELGRTTLGSAGDTITVSSLPSRKYLRLKIYLINSGQINAAYTFNSDTGSNYAVRASNNGAADGTATSQSSFSMAVSSASVPFYTEIDVVNISAQEKLFRGWTIQQNTAGAANVPDRKEVAGKWANTSATISSVTITNTGTGDYATGSEIIVLGHN